MTEKGQYSLSGQGRVNTVSEEKGHNVREKDSIQCRKGSIQ